MIREDLLNSLYSLLTATIYGGFPPYIRGTGDVNVDHQHPGSQNSEIPEMIIRY